MNPILKTRGGPGITGSLRSRGVYVKRWAYLCPECPDAKPVIASVYNRHDTRKGAKDALHRHMIKQHGMPR